MDYLFREWQDIWIPELKERELEVSLTEKARKITTFTGVRRAGKTYAMFQIIKKLSGAIPKDRIFYINFEDERIEKTTESLTKIIPALIKLYGNGNKKYFLFLDEVQIMPEWSRWLRRINDTYRNITLFVSGSSSKLSSKEIPTELRGRAINYEIFPLSFREFLNFKGIATERGFEQNERRLAEIKRALADYVEYGGFPEIVIENSVLEKKKIILDYFKTIVSRDIEERHNIRKTSLMNDFLKLLLNSKEFSVNKSVSVLRSQGQQAGKGTLLNYMKYAEESYFCFFVPMLSFKIKDQLRYPKKVYFTDNSFITNLSLRFSKNFGRLYENLVAVELCRKRAGKPGMEIFYWKDGAGREIDFVIKDGIKIAQLIQVCYDISDPDTKEREVKALLKAGKEIKCKKLLVITDDYSSVEKIGGKKIEFMPIWKWLLEQE